MKMLLASALIVSGGGGGLIHMLLFLIVVGVVLGIFYWLVNAAPFIPEMFKKVLCWLIIAVGALILINCLLGMVGHPIVAFD